MHVFLFALGPLLLKKQNAPSPSSHTVRIVCRQGVGFHRQEAPAPSHSYNHLPQMRVQLSKRHSEQSGYIQKQLLYPPSLVSKGSLPLHSPLVSYPLITMMHPHLPHTCTVRADPSFPSQRYFQILPGEFCYENLLRDLP